MNLINGEYKQHIDSSDRGFQYGDGLFETIEISQGRPLFLDLHLQRLQRGCLRLAIPCPALSLLNQEAHELCRQHVHAVLKIIVTRGIGGRGYRQPEPIQPTRVLSLHPYPDYPFAYSEQGIQVRFCNTRLGLNPALAGIKHLNRLEQVLARAEWQDSAIQEGIMLDVNDYVVEGTMSNIFYIKSGIFYTPALLESGVLGIMRSVIIDLLAARQIDVIEQKTTKKDLLSAEQVFVCNSIIGIWPVVQIADTPLSVGENTKQIQCWLAQLKHENTGDAL
ncbi:MAG: aminodeoxychorismate lyase [Methylococcales bacterium]